jgi:hypothetical protein
MNWSGLGFAVPVARVGVEEGKHSRFVSVLLNNIGVLLLPISRENGGRIRLEF